LIKPNTDVRPKFNRAAASSTVNKTFSASAPSDERATSHLTSRSEQCRPMQPSLFMLANLRHTCNPANKSGVLLSVATETPWNVSWERTRSYR